MKRDPQLLTYVRVALPTANIDVSGGTLPGEKQMRNTIVPVLKRRYVVFKRLGERYPPVDESIGSGKSRRLPSSKHKRIAQAGT